MAKKDLIYQDERTVQTLESKDGLIVQHTKQDVSGFLGNMQEIRNVRGKAKYEETGTYIGSAPMSVVLQWMQEGFDVIGGPAASGMTREEFDRELMRRLNDMPRLKSVEAKL